MKRILEEAVLLGLSPEQATALVENLGADLESEVLAPHFRTDADSAAEAIVAMAVENVRRERLNALDRVKAERSKGGTEQGKRNREAAAVLRQRLASWAAGHPGKSAAWLQARLCSMKPKALLEAIGSRAIPSIRALQRARK